MTKATNLNDITWLDVCYLPAFVFFCLLGKWLEIDE